MDRTETARTKRALASLADADSDTAESYADVVDTAVAALDDVEAAASFLDAGGERRLATAVVQAVRAEDHDTVRCGRHALRALRSFQSALAQGTRSREPSASTGTAALTDHFHHAHGTVLGDAGERDDR